MLAGEALTKRYGPTTALDGASLAVAAGESVAVMGPSGSGKTSLLHCLAGIVRPDSGRVLLDGVPVQGWGEARRSELRRTRYGFVFQSGQLLPELPAEENIALPLLLAGRDVRDAVARARTWLQPLGLTGLGGRRPGELSGGQAQRVAIARALVTGASVVFADEPTGALDSATSAEVMEVLRGATHAAGAALVLVTHDPDIAAWCDRTVLVRDGRAAPGEHPGGNRGGDRGGDRGRRPGAVRAPGPRAGAAR
ncbi:ABC transporter ATP-binding protein [Kineococcus sp. NUM-3379]